MSQIPYILAAINDVILLLMKLELDVWNWIVFVCPFIS